MKKLALLFAGLSLFVATGCNNDDETVHEVPLTGVWQPIKEVHTLVPVGGSPVSDEITYTTCQKDSRWRFNTETAGKVTWWRDSALNPGSCEIDEDHNFTYTYDKGTKAIQIKYQGIVEPDKGKVTKLDDTTLNLTIEDTTDPTEYQSVTYTMKRVVQQ
ncbi:Lipocalin-like domain-containing protein [Chryseobacterium sp. RU37D]|uniref:lipocalin family protein n=1 Tax=Chryseobacterium sp. RU37D TaxID=1907397 RepID=UPI000954B757|nr:lipocalin family protein [Chryseobacterium sp. RU37D]SIP98369.1 Lipocalin-like domain-containing protein [Chryseobacterium sp. RU37D]